MEAQDPRQVPPPPGNTAANSTPAAEPAHPEVPAQQGMPLAPGTPPHMPTPMPGQVMAPNAATKFCQTCGQVVNMLAEICPHCGVRVGPPPQQTAQMHPGAVYAGPPGHYAAPTSKNRITAALLAVFLGGLGAHKFYLNETGLGILYLVFFWTFIPAVIAFVEFIIFLTMSDEEFNRKYAGR